MTRCGLIGKNWRLWKTPRGGEYLARDPPYRGRIRGGVTYDQWVAKR